MFSLGWPINRNGTNRFKPVKPLPQTGLNGLRFAVFYSKTEAKDVGPQKHYFSHV